MYINISFLPTLEIGMTARNSEDADILYKLLEILWGYCKDIVWHVLVELTGNYPHIRSGHYQKPNILTS